MWKSRFRPAFGVHVTQTLIKLYNLHTKNQGIWFVLPCPAEMFLSPEHWNVAEFFPNFWPILKFVGKFFGACCLKRIYPRSSLPSHKWKPKIKIKQKPKKLIRWWWLVKRKKICIVGIWIPTIWIMETFEYQSFLRLGLQMVWYSNGRLICYVLKEGKYPFSWSKYTTVFCYETILSGRVTHCEDAS